MGSPGRGISTETVSYVNSSLFTESVCNQLSATEERESTACVNRERSEKQKATVQREREALEGRGSARGAIDKVYISP